MFIRDGKEQEPVFSIVPNYPPALPLRAHLSSGPVSPLPSIALSLNLSSFSNFRKRRVLLYESIRGAFFSVTFSFTG